MLEDGKQLQNERKMNSKLILKPDLRLQVEGIANTLLHPKDWTKLRIPHAPQPSVIALFEGPPGVGKTATCYELIHAVMGPAPAVDSLDTIDDDKPLPSFVEINMGKIGGIRPGESERKIEYAFEEAQKRAGKNRPACILMDECDAILFNRENIGKENTFMLGVIAKILTSIDKMTRKRCLIMMTTNFSTRLDPALSRRITDHLFFESSPELLKEVWMAKCPETSPLFSAVQDAIPTLVKLNISPAIVEQSLTRLGRRFMAEGEQALTGENLITIAKQWTTKK